MPPLSGTAGVMVQVNTSGEESKSGVEPGTPVVDLAKHIAEECANFRFRGLMTIGMPDYTSRPENFEALRKCREEVCAALGRRPGGGGALDGDERRLRGSDRDGKRLREGGIEHLRGQGLLQEVVSG